MIIEIAMRRCLILLLCCILFAGCSVGMALSGKKDPDLSVIRVGATRGEVEMHLGQPTEILQQDGRRIDIYEYEIGNEPSAGRALGHGVMDVLTLGIWEVVGTPIEGFQGEKRRMKITFDDNDKVIAVGSMPMPKKEIKSDANADTNSGVTIN